MAMDLPPATPIGILGKHLLDVEQYRSPMPKRARSLHFRGEQAVLTFQAASPPLPSSTPRLSFDTQKATLGCETARRQGLKRAWDCASPRPLNPLITLTPSPGVRNAELICQAMAKRQHTLRVCLQSVGTEGLVGPAPPCAHTPQPVRLGSASPGWIEAACESVMVTPLLQRRDPAVDSSMDGPEDTSSMEFELNKSIAAGTYTLQTPVPMPKPKQVQTTPFAGSFLYREFIRSSPLLKA